MATQTTQLSVVDNNANNAPAEYTTAQIELIKKTVAAGCSNDELALFLEVCRGSGLNPFMKQIYAIKRGDKMTVQTGIDGYRLLAARTGALAGIDDAIYDYEDAERPAWARVTVWRLVQGQRVPFTAKARWNEYAAQNKDGHPSGLWGKMPYLMLGKCAEALALRKAFPAELSGVYTAEEMEQAGGQADNPPTPYVESAPAATVTPQAEDRAARAMRDKQVMDLLIARQRFNDADRRAELAGVFDAIEQDGRVINLASIRAELKARLSDLEPAAETALEGVDMGAPGKQPGRRSAEMCDMAQPRKRAPRKRASKVTYSPDVLRLALDAAITAAGLPPARKEFQFARAAIGRQWRLDLSWPEVKICLEIEGGTHIAGGGAHQRAGRGGRYLSDMEKYNQLALWGWLLVRVTYEMIADGRALAWLEEAFASRAAERLAQPERPARLEEQAG